MPDKPSEAPQPPRSKESAQRPREPAQSPRESAPDPERPGPAPAYEPLAPGDWTPEEFRRNGHAAVDWVAGYLARVGELPVLARVHPGEIREKLPKHAPENGELFARMLEDLDGIIIPGVTHWNHPGFFAYFGITGSGPGILGELVASAFNTNGMLWRTSPSTTELEQTVLDWLREMIGLPSGLFGILTDTASVSTFVSLAAAREAVPGLNVREEGLAAPGAPRLRMYTSVEAHSSVEKGALALGLGKAGVRKIPVDDEFRMDVAALEEAIREDRAAGWFPFAVSATVGTTSSTSVDPVPRIADVCDRERLWLHVDAAYAGSAAVLPEKRWCLAGCDRADSLVVNPHKWLFTPIDASALYTRRPDVLRRAFQLVPVYLESPDSGTNLMDYGIQLGRRFRAIKLWWVLRSFGVNGLRKALAEHCRLAGLFSSWIDQSPGFQRMAPVPFSTVCFRAVWDGLDEQETERRNSELLDRINTGGRVFLSHTRLHGKYSLRLAIGNLRTRERHVRLAWDLLQKERPA
jgi:aromatic-L-amino-acid decarboxylase